MPQKYAVHLEENDCFASILCLHTGIQLFLYAYTRGKMTLSYKKLWHRLIDRDMTKTELQKAAGLSWGTMAKLNKGESVNTSILLRICTVLDCDVSDIMETVRTVQEAK